MYYLQVNVIELIHVINYWIVSLNPYKHNLNYQLLYIITSKLNPTVNRKS